jgi:hypothetical protein
MQFGLIELHECFIDVREISGNCFETIKNQKAGKIVAPSDSLTRFVFSKNFLGGASPNDGSSIAG